jgi:hypothetical protein
MDRYDLNKDTKMQVTVDEIINELNRQIMNLNFELTVNKMAVQKLQNLVAEYEQSANKNADSNVSTF